MANASTGLRQNWKTVEFEYSRTKLSLAKLPNGNFQAIRGMSYKGKVDPYAPWLLSGYISKPSISKPSISKPSKKS